jgi:hypothetical protein
MGLRGRKTLRVGSDVTSVNLSVHTPEYQSKMGIYIGKMTSVPSSVQPLATGCCREPPHSAAYTFHRMSPDQS